MSYAIACRDLAKTIGDAVSLVKGGRNRIRGIKIARLELAASIAGQRTCRALRMRNNICQLGVIKANKMVHKPVPRWYVAFLKYPAKTGQHLVTKS